MHAGLQLSTAHSLGLYGDPFGPVLAVQMSTSPATAAESGAIGAPQLLLSDDHAEYIRSTLSWARQAKTLL